MRLGTIRVHSGSTAHIIRIPDQDRISVFDRLVSPIVPDFFTVTVIINLTFCDLVAVGRSIRPCCLFRSLDRGCNLSSLWIAELYGKCLVIYFLRRRFSRKQIGYHHLTDYDRFTSVYCIIDPDIPCTCLSWISGSFNHRQHTGCRFLFRFRFIRCRDTLLRHQSINGKSILFRIDRHSLLRIVCFLRIILFVARNILFSVLFHGRLRNAFSRILRFLRHCFFHRKTRD